MIDITTPKGFKVYVSNKLSVDDITKLNNYINSEVLVFVKKDSPYYLSYENAMCLINDIMHSSNYYYSVKYKIDNNTITISYNKTFNSPLSIILYQHDLEEYVRMLDFYGGMVYGHGSVYNENNIHKAIDKLLVEKPELFCELECGHYISVSVGKIVGQLMRLLRGKANPTLLDEIVTLRLKTLHSDKNIINLDLNQLVLDI